MAAIDFPAAPTDGQLFTAGNGVTYQWSAAKSVWLSTPFTGLTAAPTYDVLSTLLSDPNTLGSQAVDTPMQITAGQPVFTRSFAAIDPSHPIEVDITAPAGLPGTAAWVQIGLFIDGAASAVAQTFTTINTSWATPMRLYWQGVLSAGAHTFHVRFGCNGTTGYLNGTDGARRGGGSMRTTMTIREQGLGSQGPPGQPGPLGGYQPGDTITTYRTVASVGWLVMDDGTIGDASSGATTRANADTVDLFAALWPLAGCTIAGGKGASAAADFAAHKALALPKVLSRLLAIGGAAGAGLNAHAPADTVGTSEAPRTGVSDNPQGLGPPPGGWVMAGDGHTHAQSMPPTTYLKMHIKL